MNDKKKSSIRAVLNRYFFLSFSIKELSKIAAKQKDACGQKHSYDDIQPAVWMQNGPYKL